jgi:hypothetical protein
MPEGACRTELGVSGTRFTINEKPTFLLGISFYGALGEPQDLMIRDLDEMRHYGFNWFRVWATWSAFGNNVSAVDNEGNPREPYLSRLRRLVEEAEKRSMIVDVTLSRGDTVNIPPRLRSTEAMKRAAATVVGALREYRNWYLDMANERNVQDSRFVSFEELREIRNHVNHLDPKRLVTASHSRDIPENDLREYILTVQVDFIAPHRPRRASSADETEEMTRKYIEKMKLIGRLVPVHYQEPFRRGFNPENWEPRAEDFIRDLEGARRGGAAGWCLHNGDQRDKPDRRPRRSFDLRDGSLFSQLDSEEKKVLDYIRSIRGVD